MSENSQSPLPRRLREARKAAKLTQEELGRKAGLEESVISSRISQYENGVHTPDFGMLKRFAEVLELPTAYFYCEEDDLAEKIKEFKAQQNDG